MWTGSEMIFIAGEQGHRYRPATDTWEAMTTVGHPGGVTDFSAVWTGTPARSALPKCAKGTLPSGRVPR